MDKKNIYLSFFNNLELPISFLVCLAIKPHPIKAMAGWHGIDSISFQGVNQEIYDLDIRYAWGKEIFQQNLFDHGWTEDTLLYKKSKNESSRHKLIIYLCEASTGLNLKQKNQAVPEHFNIGQYWKTINHCYLLLPREHPFELPKLTNQIITDNNLATKSLFTNEEPNINNNSDQLKTFLFLPPNSERKAQGGLRTKRLFKYGTQKIPLISIITVVFNGEKYLEQTIQSIINLSYPNIEYIVIDGCSTDSSLEIIKKYENQIDYWISEPDSGIYDAMNKGTMVALGSHTLHINSDDLIFDFQAIEKRLNESLANEKDLYSLNLFSSIFFYRLEEKKLVKKNPTQPYQDRDMNIIHVPTGHQGFIGLKTPISIFDISYQITAARGVIANKTIQEKISLSSTPIAICRSGGVSYGFNPKISAEIRQAVSGSKNIKVIISLLWRDTRIKLLQFAKVTGLIKIKKKILG